jgi:nucleotide-binding universal stress UspA family protein
LIQTAAAPIVRPMDLRRILVTSDLSPESLRPLRPVHDLAQRLGAQITLLTVVPEQRAVPTGAPLAPLVTPIDLDEEVSEARAVLERQARELLGIGASPLAEAITGFDVAQAIVDYAEQHAFDLVALSTHGRTGWRHLAFGSIAEDVLRRCRVPVLIFQQARQADGPVR